MFNIQVNPKASQEAINKAFDKAQAQAGKYILRFFYEEDGTVWCIVNNINNGAKYRVELHHIFDECIICNCPDYGYSHFCKHCALAVEEVQLMEMIEIYSSIDGDVPEVKC